MKPHSRQLVHVGINFLTIPAITISSQKILLFQQALLSEGLEYDAFQKDSHQIIVVRENLSPLQIQVSLVDSQLAQLLIVSGEFKAPLEHFIQEAQAALNAFNTVWPSSNRQLVKADTTLRDLHETTSEHAFQELWETRLGQSSKVLGAFGRPIRGGGLRFVMDPIQSDPRPAQIEVKIESFLRDTKKIFVETQHSWPVPLEPGEPFTPDEYLNESNNYVTNHVQGFLTGEGEQNVE